MVKILTKADVTFDELRVFRQLQPDGITYKWYITIGYDISTIEGEVIHRDKQIELSALQITTASNFLVNIKNQVKTEEGIV